MVRWYHQLNGNEFEFTPGAVLLEKTLENPLDSKEIKPVNSKEINPKYLLEGLMLKLQYFGHLTRRVNSIEKTLML